MEKISNSRCSKYNKFIILTILGVAMFFNSFGQTRSDSTVPSPEFNNEVMFVKKNNTLSKLEKVDINADAKMGFGNAKSYLSADGCCSNVFHSGKTTNRFIVKIEPGVDPENIFQLVHFKEVKGKRKILTGKVTMMKTIRGTTRENIEKIKLTFSKVGNGVYIMSPLEDLAEGEYVFLTLRNTGLTAVYSGYCFAVETKK